MDSLEQDVEEALNRALAGIPWVLRATTGEPPLTVNNVSMEELLHGLTIWNKALHATVIRLAQEIDALRSA